MRTYAIRFGIAVLAVAVIALSGFLLSLSSDPALNATGWQIFRFGLMGVFSLMDLLLAISAVWAWREGKGMAGSLVLATFLFLTLATFSALFWSDLTAAYLLFVAGAVVGLAAPFVQAIHDRHQGPSGSPR